MAMRCCGFVQTVSTLIRQPLDLYHQDLTSEKLEYRTAPRVPFLLCNTLNEIVCQKRPIIFYPVELFGTASPLTVELCVRVEGFKSSTHFSNKRTKNTVQKLRLQLHVSVPGIAIFPCISRSLPPEAVPAQSSVMSAPLDLHSRAINPLPDITNYYCHRVCYNVKTEDQARLPVSVQPSQKKLFVTNFKKITPNFDLLSSDTHLYKYIANRYNHTCKYRSKIIISEFHRKIQLFRMITPIVK